jgi:hypothetical protein
MSFQPTGVSISNEARSVIGWKAEAVAEGKEPRNVVAV